MMTEAWCAASPEKVWWVLVIFYLEDRDRKDREKGQVAALLLGQMKIPLTEYPSSTGENQTRCKERAGSLSRCYPEASLKRQCQMLPS